MSSSGDRQTPIYRPDDQTSSGQQSVLTPRMPLNGTRDLWDKADWASKEYFGHDATSWPSLKERYFWNIAKIAKPGGAASLVQSLTSVDSASSGAGRVSSEQLLRTMLQKLTVAPVIADDDEQTQRRRMAELVWRVYGTLYDRSKGRGAFQVDTGYLHPVLLKDHSGKLWRDSLRYCRETDALAGDADPTTANVAMVVLRAVQGGKIPGLSDCTGLSQADAKRQIESSYELACSSDPSKSGW